MKLTMLSKTKLILTKIIHKNLHKLNKSNIIQPTYYIVRRWFQITQRLKIDDLRIFAKQSA